MGRINKNADTYLDHIDSQHDVKRVPVGSSNSDLNTDIFNDIGKLRKKSLTVSKDMIIQLGEKIRQKNTCWIIANFEITSLEILKQFTTLKGESLVETQLQMTKTQL